MEKENYYEILGISPDASQEEIEKTLHEQLRKWSRRLNAPTMAKRHEAEKMLAKLEKMKEVLLDEEKRKQYDQELNKEKKKATTVQRSKRQREDQEVKSEQKSEKEKVITQEVISQEVKTKKEPVTPPSPIRPQPEPPKEVHVVKKQWVFIQNTWLIVALSVVLVVTISFIGWNLYADQAISSQSENGGSEGGNNSSPPGKEVAQEIKTLAQEGRVPGIQASVGDPVSEIEQEIGNVNMFIGHARAWESKTNYTFYEDNNEIISLVVGEIEKSWIDSTTEFPKYFGLPAYYKNLTVKEIEEVFGQPTVTGRINYYGKPADVYYYQLNEKMAIDFVIDKNKALFFRVGDYKKYFGRRLKDDVGRQMGLGEITESTNLAEEIKEYASQGKVYGIPFGIGATVEEVRAAWGEPESGQLNDGEENYYPGRHISLRICEQKVCEITAVQIVPALNVPELVEYGLPPRYQSLTFAEVMGVFGNNYTIEDKEYIYRISNYELRFYLGEGDMMDNVIRYKIRFSS